MGSWGYQPLENDSASDLQSEFQDSNDVGILERALDVVVDLQDGQSVEAPDAEVAIAAAYIIKDLKNDKLGDEDKNRLVEKVDKALNKVLENSELKDLWLDSSEYDVWVKSVESLKF